MPCECQDCKGGRLPGNLLTVRAQHRLPLAKQACGVARKGSHPVMKPDSHKPQRPPQSSLAAGMKEKFHIWAPSPESCLENAFLAQPGGDVIFAQRSPLGFHRNMVVLSIVCGAA